jgi:mannose-6-phosphate isomerase-like protein (cupin superfamily)
MLVIAQLTILSMTLVLQSVATDPPGFVLWPQGIPAGDPNSKVPFPNHTLSISHRDKDGLVEVHEKFADVIVIQTGKATLIVGGEVVEPASTESGEIRGKSIRGGIRRTVSSGDVIHIGAGTPHQFLIAPGEQITHILVKIAAPS